MAMSEFERGRMDCIMDSCENAPFASIGGLSARESLTAPKYIAPADAAEYLRGYEAQALAMYGDDWRTCSFSWRLAITIEGKAGDE
jgi:hypothetical protein